MTRLNLFDAERRRVNIVAANCDPTVAHAVLVCLESFKPNDSLTIGVRSRSIPAKIAKHLDPAIADFAHRNSVPLGNLGRLSELVLDRKSMDLKIHIWGRHVIEWAGHCGNVKAEQVIHTVDTVRNFVRFCHTFRSTRHPIQTYEKGLNGNSNIYDVAARRSRPRKGPYPNFIEVGFDEEGRCELCCRHTETESFRLERIAVGDNIDPKIPLSVPSLSSRYCANHASTAGSEYKRDVVRREYWHAMMRAVIEARRDLGLNAMDFQQLRLVTYDLVFSQTRVLPSVKSIRDYIKNPPMRIGEPDSRTHLLGLLRLAISEVKKHPPDLISLFSNTKIEPFELIGYIKT